MNELVTVDVLLFAQAAELVGASTTQVRVESGSTVGQLQTRLGDQHPELQQLLALSRWAVEHSFVDMHTEISGNEPVAMIPPVSGG